jgi:hypothetical protein
MGKSFGILMGLRCKQKLEYSSDRYEKSLLKLKKLGGGHEFLSKPTQSD